MVEIYEFMEEIYFVSILLGGITLGFTLLGGYLLVKTLESLKEND